MKMLTYFVIKADGQHQFSLSQSEPRALLRAEVMWGMHTGRRRQRAVMVRAVMVRAAAAGDGSEEVDRRVKTTNRLRHHH